MPVHLHIAYEYICMVMVDFSIDTVATNDMGSLYSLVITILISSKYIKKQNPSLGKTVDPMIKFDNDTEGKRHYFILLSETVTGNY